MPKGGRRPRGRVGRGGGRGGRGRNAGASEEVESSDDEGWETDERASSDTDSNEGLVMSTQGWEGWEEGHRQPEPERQRALGASPAASAPAPATLATAARGAHSQHSSAGRGGQLDMPAGERYQIVGCLDPGCSKCLVRRRREPLC
jgi:hypothetical protein